MMKPAIDTIVFDIGWVLVRFNYQPTIDLLRARGCPVDDLHAVLERAALTDHESGRLHGHGLLDRLAGLTSAPVTHAELHEKWVGMFELDAPMLELAHRLSEHHRVYCFPTSATCTGRTSRASTASTRSAMARYPPIWPAR